MGKENYSSNVSTMPLSEEYEAQQHLFEAQPALTQRFLEAQGKQLADAIVHNQSYVRFNLPDRVVVDPSASALVIPSDSRLQETGGVIDRLTRSDARTVLRQRLSELEDSSRRSVAVGGQQVRFATARAMVYSVLPSGRSVTYTAPQGEEIPSIPVERESELGSAILATTDAVAEEGAAEPERGELQVPFTVEARRFYLPQWVAFDLDGGLLVHSIAEAEADVASMQHFLEVLHAAVALAPYFVADAEYQKKRYGMLGQLVHQGRALANFQTQEIIRIIQQRAAAHDLNRGLSLSLPFFDDQSLEMKTHNFVVIPAGRIMFVPAFVVRASREEQAKVAQDTRLSPSTRKYLLNELKSLEAAFLAS